MNKIDFFSPADGECASSSKPRFYLYDGGDSTPVCMKEELVRHDCTPVMNESGSNIIIRPVDHVLYPETGGPMHCDAFLHDTARDRLCFVEMKCVRCSWMSEAYGQLLQTVRDFISSHPQVAGSARIRRAYAANSKHPNFQYSQSEAMHRFWCETRFSLRFENCVSMD